MSVVSRFSNSLTLALRQAGDTQTAFATRVGIDAGLLNKYARGKVDCGAGNIQAIARGLPENQRADVVAAWLRDMIPEIASGLVNVVGSGDLKMREHPTLARGELAPELQRAVDYLIAQACKHTEISDLLIDLARALKGTR